VPRAVSSPGKEKLSGSPITRAKDSGALKFRLQLTPDKSGWDKWSAALSELKHAAARIEGVFNPVENVFVTPAAPRVDSSHYIT